MYEINIAPYLFKYGAIEIRYYGLVYILGFLLVYYILNKKKNELNLNDETLDSFIFNSMIGLIVGARLMHFLINQPSIFFTNPLELFKVWNGGMSFFGALIGILVSGIYFVKKYKLDFFKLADLIVVPVSFTLILGRVANLINQELVGTVTNVNWCFNFIGYEGCRHPYQFYAAMTHLILFLILLLIVKIKQQKKLQDGMVLLNFVLFYSILRFIVDFFREDPRIFMLTSWQYISILTVIIVLIYFRKGFLHRK